MTTARLLLVHGAWHGPWCFEHLRGALSARRVEADAVELPFTSFGDDAAAVATAIDRLAADGTPVVVAGHSYGGAVITAGAAGTGEHLAAAHLVYLAALMPDPDRPVDLEPTPGLESVRIEGDTCSADPDRVVECFYHRAPGDVASWARSRLRAMPFSTLAASATPAAVAWREIPSTYVVCAADRVISPGDQRRFAAQAGRSLELDADHSPFFSQVDALAGVLEETVLACSVTSP